jgi:hypothetical protein
MSRLCSFNRALVRLAILAATAWSLAGPVSAGVQDSVFSVGADGTVAFDVRDVARRDVLQRLVQGRAVELEWVDPAFADERITGVFNGSADAVLQRLLAQTDFVAVYDRQGGKPRIARLIIVGKAASPGKAVTLQGTIAPSSQSPGPPGSTGPPPGPALVPPQPPPAPPETPASRPPSRSIAMTPPSPEDLARPFYRLPPPDMRPPAFVPPPNNALPLLVPRGPMPR